MILEIGRSVGGGYDEVRTMGHQNTPMATQTVRVMDASTPVPNCRASELLVAAWVHSQVTGEVKTYFSLSGAVGEYGPGWGIQGACPSLLGPWYEFWDGIPFVRKERLLPHTPIGLAPGANEITQRRSARFREVNERLAQYLGRGNTADVGVDELSVLLRGCPLAALRKLVPHGKVIGRFPCPACSVSIASYHAVRWSESCGYQVTFISSSRPMNCRGSRIFSRRVNDGTDVGFLTQVIGFVMNGLAAYSAVDRLSHHESGMYVRDYSNPRGTLKVLRMLWGNRLRITTRITVKRQDGTDAGWDDLQRTLDYHGPRVGEALADIPAVSDGRTVMMTLPW